MPQDAALECNRQRLAALVAELRARAFAFSIRDAHFEYASLPALVAREGKWCELSSARHDYMAFGFCFYNARRALDRWFDALGPLQYWEGYALIEGEAVHHAWVVDVRGAAYDPTWHHESGTATALWGVPVDSRLLDWHWRLCGGASFLEDPHHGWPAQWLAMQRWPTELPREFAALYASHCLEEVRAGRATMRPDGSIWHAEHLGPLSRQLEAQADMRSDLHRV